MRQTLLACLSALALSQLPPWPSSYALNRSTVLMVCNSSGLTDPESVRGWSLLFWDWSNGKQMWAAAKPMNAEELLVEQVARTAAALPDSRSFVYRNAIKALPWFSTVRTKLVDPAYAAWFVAFGPPTVNGTGWHVPACDANYEPPLCSALYHDSLQTPGYPTGDGVCAPPACDVGAVPAGEYVFDMRSVNVSVRGQTLADWFVDEYLFSASGGGNANISGWYLDDYWTTMEPSEMDPHAVQDMGLSPADVAAMSAAFQWLSEKVYAATLSRGRFSWNQFFDNGVDCIMPLVTKDNCALDLRTMCTAEAPEQTRAMLYGFSPGSCRGTDVANLSEPLADVVNFQLIRGAHAYLGNGWVGCSQSFERPAILDADFGDPAGLCTETTPGSGVFQRDFAHATVQMDCSSWTPSIAWRR